MVLRRARANVVFGRGEVVVESACRNVDAARGRRDRAMRAPTSRGWEHSRAHYVPERPPYNCVEPITPSVRPYTYPSTIFYFQFT